MRSETAPRHAVLCLNSYSGRSETPVLVIGETPKRYRIRAVEETRTAGRLVYLEAGQETLVPKYSVRFT